MMRELMNLYYIDYGCELVYYFKKWNIIAINKTNKLILVKICYKQINKIQIL